MGKVKKLRQKYHLSLKKNKSDNNVTPIIQESKLESAKEKSFMASKDNIFAGMDISWDDINTSLPKDFDVRSVISTKSRKELKEEEKHLKKKEKKKLRHERFMQKLDVTQQLMKKSKSKKKNKKKSAENDMSAILEALPSLQSLATDSSVSSKNYEKTKTKKKGILKAKQRLKQQSVDVKVFKHILDDKTFKENPLQTISQYLKQKVAMET